MDKCAVCKSSSGVQKCSGCKGLAYCGKDHQKDDWKAHKPVCSQIKLANESGFVKEIISAGNGEHPKAGQTVHMKYVGKFADGKQFDAGDHFDFPLGQGRVIKGWDLGVAQMTKGEKAKLYISSAYAYGERGAPPTIPPGCPLVFEVELMDF